MPLKCLSTALLLVTVTTMVLTAGVIHYRIILSIIIARCDLKPYETKPKRIIITTLCLIAGNALLAFLVAAFIIPHNIIMGGTTGIGIVLNRLIPSVSVSVFVLILNISLLIFGLFALGKKFFFTTIASSVLYPIMLEAFSRIPGIDSMTDNTLLAAVFAGCLMGVALGLVMRVGSSTGGMDVVNLVFSRWLHLPVALLVYITDIIVVGGQALMNPPESILLGILVLVLESIILDKVMILGKSQIQVYVVSEKHEEIRAALLNELDVGVTMTLIETGKLQQQSKGVMCVISQRKLYSVTELIRAIDPAVFITITQIREVRGRGFTIEKKHLDEK